LTLESSLVQGPYWTISGIEESAGRNPLRVEAAVAQLVDRLLPGIITTTRHARMYSVHAHAWSESQESGMGPEESADLLRRSEAVMAAIHYLHEEHRVQLSTAHGEDRVPLFLGDTTFDVLSASRRGTGISKAGFSGVYHGPCVRAGVLSDDDPPVPGPRADREALKQGLDGLLELARADEVPAADLRDAGHLCLCQVGTSQDGEWLRKVLVEEPEADWEADRFRSATCLLLIRCLDGNPTADPLGLFREATAFGPRRVDMEGDDLTRVECLWQAAALRNYSVTAWRKLWRWLTDRLNEEPMTAEELGSRFASSLEDVTVRQMLDGLPERIEGDVILPAEVGVIAEGWSPMVSIRTIGLGALRLDDLEDSTLKAFVGKEKKDLGPRWVRELLDDAADTRLRSIARDLAVMLVRRAKRVAHSKMYLTRRGRLYVPSRLRDRDGVLSVTGIEGDSPVALRTGSLAEILTELGYLQVDDDRRFSPTAMGKALLTDHG